MKLVHFADLHLGIENYGTLDPKTGLSTRVADSLRTFDEVIDFALEENADAVLFCGDAFKNRDPNPTVQRYFAHRIRRLSKAGIPIVLLIGNHDLPGINARSTAMEIYEALEVENVYVARRPDQHTIRTRSGPLQIVALPWITRTSLLANDELRKLSPEDQQDRVADSMAAAVSSLAGSLDTQHPSILMAHINVEGATLGAEQSIMLGQDLVLDTSQLSSRAFDYVALGHIHRHQRISASPPVVYSGSLERIDFGEEREVKGFVVIDIAESENRTTSWQFVPVSARRFVTLRVKTNTDDPLDEIATEVQRRERDIEGAVTRMFIDLTPEREDLVRTADVRRLLSGAGAHYVAQIVKEVENSNRPRIEIDREAQLDPAKLLEEWLRLRDLTPDSRERILATGKELITQRKDSG